MFPRAATRHARLLGLALGALALVPLPAAADPIRWPQPGGPGTPVQLTYSFSNLLDGGLVTTLARHELSSQVALALSVWARYAPLHFFEVADRGPAPSEQPYHPAGTPQIRFGYLPAGPFRDLAHAHFPIGIESNGLAGDVHFANDIARYSSGGVTYIWGNAIDGPGHIDFFSVAVHEVGHVLGLPHLQQPSIMYPLLFTFVEHENAYLKSNDILALQGLYGAGVGSVTPLGAELVVTPEPASIVLAALGLAPLIRRRLLRRGGAAPGAARGPGPFGPGL